MNSIDLVTALLVRDFIGMVIALAVVALIALVAYIYVLWKERGGRR